MNTHLPQAGPGFRAVSFLPQFPFWLLAALALVLPACLKAESPHPSAADVAFVHKAAQGGMAEVELGKQAASKGSAQEVREFGKKMVEDHTKINNKIKEFASKHQVELPTGLDAEHNKKVEAVSSLSGKAFDAAYLEKMKAMHAQDAVAFEDVLKTSKNEDLKKVVEEALPIIHSHQKHLENLKTGD
jgi:putative membrane protein